MGISVRGDNQKLAEMVKRIEGLANRATRQVLNSRLAETSVSLVMQGFDASISPEGVVWAPLKHRNGMPLLLTGRLRNSISWQATASGFTLGTNVVYSGVHQKGSRKKNITPRPFLPTGTTLSRKWQNAYEGVVSRMIRQQTGL